MPDRLAMVSYRPTAQQALGRGLFVGTLFTFCAAIIAVATVALTGWSPTIMVLVVVVLPALVGGAVGLVRCRAGGVEADDRGVYCLGDAAADGVGADQPWCRIVDLRRERRGGRTEVTAYLDTGAMVRLGAPYDGRLLARDPGFEHKYFTLRNIWETHRSWNMPR